MQEGDEILIVKGDQIQLLGRVAYKDVNPGLSQEAVEKYPRWDD